MNARPNLARLDELGQRLADQAFRALISLCPEIRSASSARQEAVCAAMRVKVAPSIDPCSKTCGSRPVWPKQRFTTLCLPWHWLVSKPCRPRP